MIVWLLALAQANAAPPPTAPVGSAEMVTTVAGHWLVATDAGLYFYGADDGRIWLRTPEGTTTQTDAGDRILNLTRFGDAVAWTRVRSGQSTIQALVDGKVQTVWSGTQTAIQIAGNADDLFWTVEDDFGGTLWGRLAGRSPQKLVEGRLDRFLAVRERDGRSEVWFVQTLEGHSVLRRLDPRNGSPERVGAPSRVAALEASGNRVWLVDHDQLFQVAPEHQSLGEARTHGRTEGAGDTVCWITMSKLHGVQCRHDGALVEYALEFDPGHGLRDVAIAEGAVWVTTSSKLVGAAYGLRVPDGSGVLVRLPLP